MSTGTSIEWTDATWSPLRARRKDTGKVGQHCERVSPGCANCYAAAHNHRNLPHGGTGLDYARASRDLVETFVDAKVLTQPLRWRDPRKVFVCNQTDIFAEFYSFEQIAAVFAVVNACPLHTFQVLTKRPARAREFFRWLDGHGGIGKYVRGAGREALRGFFDGVAKFTVGPGGKKSRAGNDPWMWIFNCAAVTFDGPLPNVWLGVTAEDQQRANERVPLLLATPAAMHFVSYEPALGPVDFARWVKDWTLDYIQQDPSVDLATLPPRLEWIIAGGESGPGARPCDVAWIRDIVRQCREAGTALFVKQLGARPVVALDERECPGETIPCRRLNDRKGGDMTEWPEGLRVREFPGPRP